LDSTTNTITYSLTINPDGLFQVDPNTGVVTTASAINREVHGANRSITVQASSSDGSTATQVFNISISDLDEFDVTVPADTNAGLNQVDENVAIGTTVGITSNAFDLDSTTNTITYSLTSNPDGLFQVDANTGVVTTASSINREAHGANRSITVQATSSDGSTATQVFNISINDLDEFDVTAPTDTNAGTNQVDENVAIGTTVGITANAFDLDSTTNTITYSLTSNPDGLFQVDPNTGVVTTAAAINREVHGANRSITSRPRRPMVRRRHRSSASRSMIWMSSMSRSQPIRMLLQTKSMRTYRSALPLVSLPTRSISIQLRIRSRTV
jgi:protocadherin Fat 4